MLEDGEALPSGSIQGGLAAPAFVALNGVVGDNGKGKARAISPQEVKTMSVTELKKRGFGRVPSGACFLSSILRSTSPTCFSCFRILVRYDVQ